MWRSSHINLREEIKEKKAQFESGKMAMKQRESVVENKTERTDFINAVNITVNSL